MHEKPITSFFESLGDNCEFGFVQKNEGNNEGGLLRWAISPPLALANCIREGFQGVYEFENLRPSSPKMVRDIASDLAFHTEMYSKDGKFIVSDVSLRKDIWRREFEKFSHLSSKMNAALEGGNKIFVYKRNSGISPSHLAEIGNAIAARGKGKLLYVSATVEQKVGSVKKYDDTTYIARIDRLAPYQDARNISYQVWMEILKNTLNLNDKYS